MTELRVSYWLVSDKDENGVYNAKDTATVSVHLASQTLLFVNGKAMGIEGFEDVVGSVEYFLEQKLNSMNCYDDFVIHKIWVP